MISAKENIIIPEDFVFFGEVSLSGAIRSVAKTENRLKEAEKLGFKKVASPKNTKVAKGLNIEVFEDLDLLSFINRLSARAKKIKTEDLNLNV